MKKRFAIVLSALMVLAMASVAVSAASQQATSEPVQSAEEKAEAERQQEVANFTENVATPLVKNASIDGCTVAPIMLNRVIVEANNQAAAIGGSVVAAFDVEGTPGTHVINCGVVVAGGSYAVLHQKHDGTWEQLPCTVLGNGQLQFTTTSFSPIAVVALGGTAKSPATGE